MANSIELAARYMPILDALYKRASVTSRMDALTQIIEFAGVNVIKVFKTAVVGLGTYSRATGYPAGDVTASWEVMTLAASRGREFNIDRMDNEETLDQAFGTLAGEFMRTQVTPEVDAYRFAKYAAAAGHAATPATLDASTVLAAVDTAILQMDEDEVPQDGRLLFVSSAVDSFIRAAPTRFRGNDSTIDNRVKIYNNVELVVVPQSRFYTEVTLNAGSSSSAGGYVKTVSTGKDLNFMLVYPPAIVQATKLAQMKIFSPDENQDGDNWKMQYRLYHDAFVLENKVNGVYVHNKA